MRDRIPPANIRLKRAYEPPAGEDGARILVDRLWPRGLRKADAALALWARDVAPSHALRRWFGHDPRRWQGFRALYFEELRAHSGDLEPLRALARQGPITLVYAARDTIHNEAVALRDILLGRHRGKSGGTSPPGARHVRDALPADRPAPFEQAARAGARP